MKPFLERINEDYEAMMIEHVVFRPEPGYSGRIDYLGQHKKTGQIVLMEWKTTTRLSMSAGESQHSRLQAAAYVDLIEQGYKSIDLKIDRVWVVIVH